MIERGPYGTTCARVGCMPSKLLIAAAEAAHGPARGTAVRRGTPPAASCVDGPAVMRRVQAERDRFAGACGAQHRGDSRPSSAWWEPRASSARPR
jgi:dihydrolipoamide dehydrogenase